MRSALLAVWLLSSVEPAQATLRNPAVAGIDACDRLQNSHLIIRGTVRGVSLAAMTAAQLGLMPAGDSAAGVDLGVGMVTIDVAEVLKGEWYEPQITFIAMDGQWLFHAGKEYVICALRRGPLGEEFFLTGIDIGFYERIGSKKAWMQCQPDDREPWEALRDAQLRSRIRQGSLDQVARSSELIARGTILSAREVAYEASPGLQGKMIDYEFEIDEALKGTKAGTVIHFVVPLMSLSYVPPWFRCVPEGLAAGQTWLVFLCHGERGLYPFAGRNSLLQVDSDRLIYDTHVEYPNTLSRARVIIVSRGND